VLRSVTAGVFNIVRSFAALVLHLWGKSDARVAEAATDGTAAAIDAAATAADATVVASNAVIVADMSGITIDASAMAADAAASAMDAAATANDAAATGSAAVVSAPTGAPAAPDAAAATTAGEAAAAPAPDRSTKPQGRKVMSSGFDMQAGIARLAKRIIEPVATRLTPQELEQVVGLTRDAFERFNASRPAPETDFANMAASIVEPVQASLTDVERRRVIDRLSGAMAAFCQGVGQRAA
jgi:hypothetical protein